jgi:hypothetical protein
VTEPRDDEITQELRTLAGALDSFRAPAPSSALLERTLTLAKRELRASVAARTLPVGFRRELARLLATAGPALAIAGVGTLGLLRALPARLEAFLPEPLAWAAVLAYVATASLWLAACAGSLPLLAHRRALLRAEEAA